MAITVICGADEMEFDQLDGLEFSKVIEIARKAMNIPEDIVDVRLNGREDSADTKIVEPGSSISFYKRSGSKGC